MKESKGRLQKHAMPQKLEAFAEATAFGSHLLCIINKVETIFFFNKDH